MSFDFSKFFNKTTVSREKNPIKIYDNLPKKYKILVISKSDFKARRWRDHEMTFSSEDFTQKVEEFKKAENGILVAPARFEGMDFPGDTCRFLVVDGLPTGTGHMEKFLWKKLGANEFLRGTIASRLVQAMGRISRGNDDYGVVFLLGDDIGDWITKGNNRSVIPPYTLAQLELGEELTHNIRTIEELDDMVMSVVATQRNQTWADLHTHKIQPYSVTSGKTEETEISPDEEFNTKVALAERKFLEKFWKRQYPQAIGYLEEYQDSVYKQDKALASWHSHWIGYAYLLSGTKAAAERNFDRASKAKQALGCFNVRSDIAYVRPVTSGDTQGGRISIVLSERGNFNYGSFDEMNSRFSPLFAEKSTQFEEALFWLGRYLGFDSSRPDKNTKGRGPDVFWASPEVDILIECKDGKQETSFYSKKEVGQALNHNEWYSEEFPQSERHKKLMIVGPILPAHSTASPGEHIHIWTPSEISQLANRVSTLLYNAYTESNSATYASTLNKMLDEAGLTYMKLFKSLPDRPIKRK